MITQAWTIIFVMKQNELFRWCYFAWLNCLFDLRMLSAFSVFNNFIFCMRAISNNALQLDWVHFESAHCSRFSLSLFCDINLLLFASVAFVNELVIIEFKMHETVFFCTIHIPVTEKHSSADLKLDGFLKFDHRQLWMMRLFEYDEITGHFASRTMRLDRDKTGSFTFNASHLG